MTRGGRPCRTVLGSALWRLRRTQPMTWALVVRAQIEGSPSVAHAARVLGVSRAELYRAIKKNPSLRRAHRRSR